VPPYKKPKKFDYNLIAIGAGSAGLVTTYIGAAIKAKVALIEKHKMGGDCLNTGCVPSKALIRSAKLLHEASNSKKYGINEMRVQFDFADIMQRVQDIIGKIEPHDSVERYTELGVDCIQGAAKIVSPWEVEVNGKRLTTRSIVLATGARPLVPKIPGLETVEYLTSDNIWNLRELPKRLVVLGGGPIGCELTQSFARFGSQVTQVEMAPRLMPREDADAANEVMQQFAAEGIQVAVSHKALRVEKDGNGGVLVCESNGVEVRFGFDKILLALGRKANVEGFGLQELGITVNERGTIDANELMQTNYPNIYVCGDATGPYQFTHVASHQAWYASVNALFAPFWSFKADYRVIPWATFTHPEVARVGLSEDEAKQKNIAVEVTRYGIDDLDRAIADGNDHGFVKVLTVPGKDKILGATIVGAHAGDLLAEFVLAMKWNIGLNKLLGTIHIYPTMAEANKYAAGNWKRAHAPQAALRFAEKFFTWLRG
jgi:pyruvate/2-oxoglutarate dehydrogenase complex dihydrolipoamide dehydrogenase (E3) component